MLTKRMKVVAVVMLMAVIVIATCGCQTSKALFDDISGISSACSSQLAEMADNASERDSDRMAKKLARNQAILKARIDLAKTGQ